MASAVLPNASTAAFSGPSSGPEAASRGPQEQPSTPPPSSPPPPPVALLREWVWNQTAAAAVTATAMAASAAGGHHHYHPPHHHHQHPPHARWGGHHPDGGHFPHHGHPHHGHHPHHGPPPPPPPPPHWSHHCSGRGGEGRGGGGFRRDEDDQRRNNNNRPVVKLVSNLVTRIRNHQQMREEHWARTARRQQQHPSSSPSHNHQNGCSMAHDEPHLFQEEPRRYYSNQYPDVFDEQQPQPQPRGRYYHSNTTGETEEEEGRGGVDDDDIESQLSDEDEWVVVKSEPPADPSPPTRTPQPPVAVVASPLTTMPSAPSAQMIRERCPSPEEDTMAPTMPQRHHQQQPQQKPPSIVVPGQQRQRRVSAAVQGRTNTKNNNSTGVVVVHEEELLRGSAGTATTADTSSSVFDSQETIDVYHHHHDGAGNRERLSSSEDTALTYNSGYNNKRRPRNCLVKLKKNMGRQVKKWAASGGPGTVPPPPPPPPKKPGVEFPIKPTRCPEENGNMPLWFSPPPPVSKTTTGEKRPEKKGGATAYEKKQPSSSSRGRRSSSSPPQRSSSSRLVRKNSHDWEDPTKDGAYHSRLPPHLHSSRTTGGGRRRRHKSPLKKMKNVVGGGPQEDTSMSQKKKATKKKPRVPGGGRKRSSSSSSSKSPPRSSRRAAAVAPVESREASLPSKAGHSVAAEPRCPSLDLRAVEAIGAAAQLSKKLSSCTSSATTTKATKANANPTTTTTTLSHPVPSALMLPGAFHASPYYDALRGEVLSRVTSEVPLAPLVWSIAKAGLSLSDRAQRARWTSYAAAFAASRCCASSSSSASPSPSPRDDVSSPGIIETPSSSTGGLSSPPASATVDVSCRCPPRTLHEGIPRSVSSLTVTEEEEDKCLPDSRLDVTTEEEHVAPVPKKCAIASSCAATTIVAPPQAAATPPQPVKVLFVGGQSSGRSGSMMGNGRDSIARRLVNHHSSSDDGRPPSSKRPRRRAGGHVGVDVFRWEEEQQQEESNTGGDNNRVDNIVRVPPPNVTYNVWDLTGDRVYHATQEIFFTDGAVYVIPWNLAADKPATAVNEQGPKTRRGGAGAVYRSAHYLDSSSEEELDNADDYFALREAREQADCAIRRDVDESVLFWIDRIAARNPRRAAVLIVASCDEAGFLLGQDEVDRRCDVMHRHVRSKVGAAGGEGKGLQVTFGHQSDESLIRLNSHSSSGLEELRGTVQRLASSLVNADESGLGRSNPTLASVVSKALKEQRAKKVRAMPFSRLLKLVQEECAGEGYGPAEVWDAAKRLEECGDVTILGTRSMNDPQELFLVLSPKWLLLAISFVQRFEERRRTSYTSSSLMNNCGSDVFKGGHSNCPLVGKEEILELWSDIDSVCRGATGVDGEGRSDQGLDAAFLSALQEHLVRCKILLPIDASSATSPDRGSSLFFLPSSLQVQSHLDNPHALECWTYKCVESWKTTLCNSWKITEMSLPEEILMQRIMVAVLQEIYLDATEKNNGSNRGSLSSDVVQRVETLRLHETLCWRRAFYLKLGTQTTLSDGDGHESNANNVVEIYISLVDKDSKMCVASGSTPLGTRRLLVSAKGHEGEHGRKIWEGGFSLVNNAVQRVVADTFQRPVGVSSPPTKECVCPKCLECQDITKARVCDWSHVEDCMRRRDDCKVTCFNGHAIDARLVFGDFGRRSLFGNGFEPVGLQRGMSAASHLSLDDDSSVSSALTCSTHHVPCVKEFLGGVVIVGLWDAEEGKITRAGSGFIVDRKRGLVVTAAHTLIDMNDESPDFGLNYYGKHDCKVMIGVLPKGGSLEDSDLPSLTTAFFRYSGEIAAKDEFNVDACVVRITARLENDVGGNGADCAIQPEIPLFDKMMMKKECLQELDVATRCELSQRVNLLGYNQGGEGLVDPGSHLNRSLCYAEGYVCKWFKFDSDGLIYRSSCAGVEAKEAPKRAGVTPRAKLRRRNTSPEEIVIQCPTIGGHSGGPCLNQSGEVIGILSRGDAGNRGYLVPSNEFLPLVEKAKRPLNPLAEFL